jgi:hypothetical protein
MGILALMFLLLLSTVLKHFIFTIVRVPENLQKVLSLEIANQDYRVKVHIGMRVLKNAKQYQPICAAMAYAMPVKSVI